MALWTTTTTVENGFLYSFWKIWTWPFLTESILLDSCFQGHYSWSITKRLIQRFYVKQTGSKSKLFRFDDEGGHFRNKVVKNSRFCEFPFTGFWYMIFQKKSEFGTLIEHKKPCVSSKMYWKLISMEEHGTLGSSDIPKCDRQHLCTKLTFTDSPQMFNKAFLSKFKTVFTLFVLSIFVTWKRNLNFEWVSNEFHLMKIFFVADLQVFFNKLGRHLEMCKLSLKHREFHSL